MRRVIILCVGLVVVGAWLSSEILARGGRAGGGGSARVGGGAIGAGGGMGGGGARPGGYGGAAARTPSMSRPSVPSYSRPSGGMAYGGNRMAGPRPSYGNLPTPNIPRSGSMSNRPNIGQLPSSRPGGVGRPGAGSVPSIGTLPTGGGRLANRDLPNFADLSSLGNSNFDFGSPSTRPGGPSSGFAGGALAGGAAAAFLHDSPGYLLPGIGSAVGGPIANAFPDRPSGGAKPDKGQKPSAGDRPAVARPERPSERPDVGRPGQPDKRPTSAGQRELANSQPNRIRDTDQSDQWSLAKRKVVSDFMRNYCDDCDGWYGNEWYSNLKVPTLYSPDFNAWGSVTWPTMSNSLQPNSSNPIYYNFGTNVYYQNGSVYYGDQPVATEEEYTKQAESIAASAPATKPDKADWMPIGVFAMTAGGEPSGVDPNFFLQLAVSKQGAISGTLQNVAEKSVQPIEGMVDKQCQRAAWTLVGKTRPLMEMGAVNLTQDSSPALVHFADGTTQQCLLVRVNKPESKQVTSGETKSSAGP
jgi:hypothetical protein